MAEALHDAVEVLFIAAVHVVDGVGVLEAVVADRPAESGRQERAEPQVAEFAVVSLADGPVGACTGSGHEDGVAAHHVGRIFPGGQQQIVVEHAIAGHRLDHLQAVGQLAGAAQAVVGGIQAFPQYPQQIHRAEAAEDRRPVAVVEGLHIGDGLPVVAIQDLPLQEPLALGGPFSNPRRACPLSLGTKWLGRSEGENRKAPLVNRWVSLSGPMGRVLCAAPGRLDLEGAVADAQQSEPLPGQRQQGPIQRAVAA